jgi:hypothetical protein
MASFMERATNQYGDEFTTPILKHIAEGSAEEQDPRIREKAAKGIQEMFSMSKSASQAGGQKDPLLMSALYASANTEGGKNMLDFAANAMAGQDAEKFVGNSGASQAIFFEHASDIQRGAMKERLKAGAISSPTVAAKLDKSVGPTREAMISSLPEYAQAMPGSLSSRIRHVSSLSPQESSVQQENFVANRKQINEAFTRGNARAERERPGSGMNIDSPSVKAAVGRLSYIKGSGSYDSTKDKDYVLSALYEERGLTSEKVASVASKDEIDSLDAQAQNIVDVINGGGASPPN